MAHGQHAAPHALACRYDLPEEAVQQVVLEALELVNMQEFMYRATHTLSGGQRQRVAIAGRCALGDQQKGNMSTRLQVYHC